MICHDDGLILEQTVKAALALAFITISAATAAADDPAVSLAADLGKPWDRLIVGEKIHQSCVAPIYVGAQFRLANGTLMVARWQAANGKEVLEKEQPAAGLTVESLRLAVIEHFKATVGSKSTRQRSAGTKITTASENAFGKAGDAVAMYVRIEGNRLNLRHEDWFSDDDYKALDHWLEDRLSHTLLGK